MKIFFNLIFFLSLSVMSVFAQNHEWKITENEQLFKSSEAIFESNNWLTSFQYYDSLGHWTEIGPYTSSSSSSKDVGRLSCLTLDQENDSIVLAGSPNGGLFYTVNKGDSWINGGLDRPSEIHGINIFTPGISCIVVIHDQGKTYWIVSTGDKDQGFSRSRGVLRTSDYGKTWKKINGSGSFSIPGDWYYIRKLLPHPNNKNIMYAVSSWGLYKSENILAENPSDVKWVKILENSISNDEGFFDMEFSLISPDTVFLSREYRTKHQIAGNEILWSTDGGNNWEPVPGINLILPVQEDFNFFLTLFEVTPASPDVVYLYFKGKTPADSNNYYHKHLKYDIAQNTWTELNSIPFKSGNGRNGYAVSPVDEKMIFCATVPTFLSTDGGYNWVKDNDTLLPDGSPKNRPHSDIQDLKFNKTGTEIWAASDGGPYMKRIGDSLWQNKTNEIGFAKILKFDRSELDPDYYLFGGWDVGTQLYNKKSGVWSQGTGGDGFGCAFDDREAGIFYVAGYSGDHNIFSKFTNYKDSINYLFGDFWSANIAVPETDHNRVYISLKDSVTVSDDQGDTWHTLISTEELGLDPHNYIIYDINLSDQNANYMYLRVVNINQGTHPQIFRTRNVRDRSDLIQWENITPDPPLSYWMSDLAIDEENPDRIWVVYNTLSPEKIMEFDGKQWANISGNLTELNCGLSSVTHLKGTKKGLFAGTLYGVYYLKDDTSQWLLYKPGLPNNVPLGLKINYTTNTLLTGLDGRGLWETSLPPDYENPDKYKKIDETLKIYPNPVVDKFEVWSELFEDDTGPINHGLLRVYNSFGEVMAEFTLTGFTNSYTFSCKNWPGGIYFAVLIFDGKMKETAKIIVR